MRIMLTTLISPAPTVSAAPARVTLLRLQDGLYAARAVGGVFMAPPFSGEYPTQQNAESSTPCCR